MCSRPNCGGSCPSSTCRADNKSVYGGCAGSTGGKISLHTSNGLREPRRERVCDGSGPPWDVGQGPGSGLEFCGGTLPGWHLPPLSFAASHYYKYKQQFIFPGKALLRGRVLSCTPQSPSGGGCVAGFVQGGGPGSPKPIHCSRTACAMKILQG